ncbi:MAG: SH3 domain-containing protein [Acidobacteriota bacterium]
MKLPTLPLSLAVVFVCFFLADAQSRKPVPASRPAAINIRGNGKTAVVIDENLSLLRSKPSLFADAFQRMRRGRRVQILGSQEADGVVFYKVSVPPANLGWLQSDAVFAKFRASDEERFARLVQAADGFDRVELAAEFLELYSESRFRAPILLLFGDLLEDAAAKLSRDAGSRLSRREMAASGAPMHSFYLNFKMLDRYRRLGVTFLFNSSTRLFHYNGASWREIVRKHAAAAETPEAQRRLDSLVLKLETRAAS